MGLLCFFFFYSEWSIVNHGSRNTIVEGIENIHEPLFAVVE